VARHVDAAALHPEPMKGPMTSSTLPDISRDKLDAPTGPEAA